MCSAIFYSFTYVSIPGSNIHSADFSNISEIKDLDYNVKEKTMDQKHSKVLFTIQFLSLKY